MLFPTIRFALFFTVVLPVSWLLMPAPRRWRVFIVAASYFFYGSWDWRFVFLLAGSTFVNHVLAVSMARTPDEAARRQRLVTAIAINLGVLAWFKYAGFFGENASSVLRWFGFHVDPPFPRVVLPVGISFITFHAISYVVDVYRHRLRPAHLLDLAVYFSFFPHLVAGPIVRASELLPQLRGARNARRVDAGVAFWLIAIGLFKKVVIASYLASHAADPLFSLPFQHGGVEALIGVYAYAIQIYADFSGYTDMAIGLALLLGFQFPQNFNAPYTATSLRDFWRRWHMTLSRWLRDYLYIPLGGSAGGRWRTYRNLMLTMLLGGLWHGAGWTFVAWGALHGGGLAVERWRDEHKRRRTAMNPEFAPDPAPTVGDGGLALQTETLARPRAEPSERGVWLRRIVTFHLVCVGWVFFRAQSIGGAFDVLGRILHGTSTVAINPVVVLVIAGMLAAQYVPAEAVTRMRIWFSNLSTIRMALALGLVLLAVDVLGPDGVPPFIYFQF